MVNVHDVRLCTVLDFSIISLSVSQNLNKALVGVSLFTKISVKV